MTSPDDSPDVSADDVRAAARAIEGQVVRTTAATSRVLSTLCGCEVVLKYETQQFTGSYKERGALNRLLALTADERERGVVAVSAGNHAQGVAYHATRLGISATIVMPVGTPFVKVSRTQALGAQVELHGRTFDEAAERGRELAAAGALLIHPFDDPLIVAGQGTVGLELLGDRPDLDVVLVPIGGGGLASGIAVIAADLAPAVRVIGVQSERYPAMARALSGDPSPVPGGVTLAEGIAVARPGALTSRLLRDRLDSILLVSEREIEDAVNSLIEVERMVVEGAGAAGLAALFAHREVFADQRVGVILTGSNIDQRILAEIIERGLVRSGRIATLQLVVDDSPGRLADVLAIVAEQRANLLDVRHERTTEHAHAREAMVSLTVETLDPEHLQLVRSALVEAGVMLL